MDFILSNFRCLKIIKLPRTAYMKLKNLKWIKSQAAKALLRLQERDHEEKTIIVYHRSKENKIITLPWPPRLPSQLRTDLQA
jgi:hypothetical protein